ncbi:MAG: RNA-binding protein [Spirulinaceae cyanobacterium RM2_2_10]|nr:RNA-binding protein [Spirulinaceae cyanobacterium SM2_1_0]NJO19170.1 RNA-binding protein [Spirulinaceae cyanobacterium RM2_2_10]
MTVRLYVGNLPKDSVDRDALHEIFADFGEEVSTKVIKDRRTGKCRGFAFVTVPTDEMADALIEKHNGQSFMDNPIKIEKALPRAKSKPEEAATPGSPTASPTASPTTSPTKRSSNANSGNAASGKSRRGSGSSDAVQPDPRWADDLAKLKEMLAAQTTNS